MDEQYISIWELISLQLFLGSIIYIVGCIVLFFVLRKEVNRKYLSSTYKCNFLGADNKQ